MKARSAISLAGHGGDAVVWFDDPSGSWATSTAFAPGPVPAVQGLRRAISVREGSRPRLDAVGPPDSYLMRDAGIGERPPAGWNGLFPHPINGRGGIDAQFFALWQATPLADAYLGRMAASLVDSFSARTATGHRLPRRQLLRSSMMSGTAFGPESREIEDVLRQLDVTLGTLIAHLDAKVGRANYVLALSADHGVAPIPIAARGRPHRDRGRARADRRDAASRAGDRSQKGTYVDAVNFTDVYFADGVFDRLRANAQLMASVDSQRRGDSWRRPRAARRSTVGHEPRSDRPHGGAQLHEQPQRRSDGRAEGILVPQRPQRGDGNDARHAYRVRHARAADSLRRRHQEPDAPRPA